MNPIGETFRFYSKNCPALLRPSIFFILPPLVTLAAMVPGFMTHFGLIIEEIGRYTGGTEVPPILSQRVSDFQMFLLPLLVISQLSSFFWQGAVTHLAGTRLGLIVPEQDPGPALSTLRKFFPLLLTGVLVGALMMLTNILSMLTLFLPTIVLAVMTAYAPAAVMGENLAGGGALVRSFRLVRGRFFKTLGVRALGFALGSFLTLILTVGISIAMTFIFFPGGAADLPEPSLMGHSGIPLPAKLVETMSLTYIISLGVMLIVRFLVEIPLAFIGVALLWREAGGPPSSEDPLSTV